MESYKVTMKTANDSTFIFFCQIVCDLFVFYVFIVLETYIGAL